MKNLITGGVNIWHELAENQSAPLGADEPEGDAKPGFSANFIKLRFFIAASYAIAGLFLIFSFLEIINVYFLHLKVETAVVSVPIESLVSPMPGYVKEVFILPGQILKKGAVLMKIENLDLERDLQLAQVQVAESKLNIQHFQNLLNNEQQRLAVYKGIGSNRLVSAQAMVEISKQKYRTAEKNIERMKVLHKKHYLSDLEYDLVLEQFRAAEKNLSSVMAQRDIENDSLNAVQKGVYFTGNKLEGIERDLVAETDLANERLKLNQARVEVYANLLNKLTLVAPFDCKVEQVLKSAGTTTDNTKPLIFLEKIQATQNIIAYLTQEEVAHVVIGDRVKVYLPSIGEKYRGRVLSVNRTEGFVDEVKAQFRWRDLQLDRSAMVIIEIESDKNKIKKEVVSGMPAIVYFKRQFTVF